MQNKFYIYRHIRHDRNTPFYIGKGTGNRAWSVKSRNRRWKFISNFGYSVEIIMNNLTEVEAFEKEKEFIKMYKELDYCEANFTDGGSGGNTFKYLSEDDKIKFKNKMRNLINNREIKCINPKRGVDHHNYRKPSKFKGFTEDQLENVRQSKIGSKNPMYGVVGQSHPRFSGWWITPAGKFDRLKEAELANNTTQVKYRCKKSKSKKFKDWTFEEAK
jgi:hypothetical protein